MRLIQAIVNGLVYRIRSNIAHAFILVAIGLALVAALWMISTHFLPIPTASAQLLTDPFLQAPTADSVRVVWFTEFVGSQHWVEYGERFAQRATATTTKLSRMREDQQSRVGAQTQDEQIYQQPTYRDIWRHEATVTGLSAARLPYRVVSQSDNDQRISSRPFTLSTLPLAGTPLIILLTSDHQLKPMTAANLRKVVETVGQIDAVFLAGDLVDIADRASEWFDDNRGNAFFPCLQGRAAYQLEHNGQKHRYSGGAIIQSAPLFPAIGNHEVMGRFSMTTGLGKQFSDPIPRQVAEQFYQQNIVQINPTNVAAVQQSWLKNNSFNTDTYEELFTLPESAGGKKYYAVTVGDVRLISLFAANIWRQPGLSPEIRGRYQERQRDMNYPERWGYGQHIFEPIALGSPQYEWLKAELARPEFRQAKYKVVMFHHPPHSLGDNIVPAYTDPIQVIERAGDTITAVRYEYPLESDYLIRDVIPLLEQAGVQLVFYGHSHIWNRFVSTAGMNFLESSNVGNTYGAFAGEQQRAVPNGYRQTYVATGDPNGLTPVIPTLNSSSTAQQAQPYLASNDITAFSILDTGTGMVSSYRFDTRYPKQPASQFDQFTLSR